MNKSELISEISDKTKLTKIQSKNAINAALGAIADALNQDKEVNLKGFGSFERKYRPARTGRNPQTGAPLQIPGSYIASFKASKNLRDTISN